MTKTYICNECGEFNHDCNIKDEELKQCPKCKSKVKRVFKPTHYSWHCDGFAGKGHS